ncbi:hypothetical protein RND81_07G072900 [Saponaria officinalis]|uniref:AP2/ERF domain-containing protein n=1 Tax=Saponaria officinalis TaxID=3572 RepID=A0AAW1JMR5_SAPOF
MDMTSSHSSYSSLPDTRLNLSGNDDLGGSSNSNSNIHSSSSSCKYKGVRKRKWGKWVSEIRLPNSRERIWLGSYDSPEKAARAFDAAQFCLRGRSGNYNFPDNLPDIPEGRSMTPSEIQVAAARFANLTTATELNNGSHHEQQKVVESTTTSYSPSSSSMWDETVQMSGDIMVGAEGSFHEQLSLSTALGSGNYVSEFGYFTECENYILPNNFDYEDTYDTSLYQDTCLWNF